MRVIAGIEDPLVIGKILEHLDRTSAAPTSGRRPEKVVQRARFKGRVVDGWSAASAGRGLIGHDRPGTGGEEWALS